MTNISLALCPSCFPSNCDLFGQDEKKCLDTFSFSTAINRRVLKTQAAALFKRALVVEKKGKKT